MNTRTLDIGRALTFMFEEEEWVSKFLIATAMILFSVVIIPAIILQGYMIEIIRRVGHNRTPQLPEWSDWGKYLSEGFVSMVAGFVYGLPAILFSCCIFLIVLVSADSSSGELSGGAFLLICCISLLIFLVQIPLALLYFAGLIRYVEEGNISGFFQFGALWRFVRENMSLYGYAIVIILVAGVVGSFVPFLGQAWAQLAAGHALGQLLDITRGRAVMGGESPMPGEL